MNVYLVPVAIGRYELYCEVAANAPDADVRTGTIRGWFVDAFHRLVAEGEAAEDGSTPAAPPPGRLRRAITRRVAEAVAEQRLLWHLRLESAVALVHPDDMTAAESLTVARTLVGADFAKHRRWFVINAAIAAVTGPVFFFVPGPNVVSWYFAFRAVGHFFSMRGARKGLTTVTWTGTPSAALTDLRTALALDRELRDRRVDEIATALGLSRLAFFVQKIA